jgi:hypothetical protein
MHSSSDNLPL